MTWAPTDLRIVIAYYANDAQPTITQSVFETVPELKAGDKPSGYVSREQLEELFGIGGREVKVAHAPLPEGERHHELDIEALQSFIAAYGAGDAARHPKLEPTSWRDTLSGTLVLAGGPVSNVLTRALMQYTCINPANPRQGLITEIKDRYLDFQYHYVVPPFVSEARAIYDRSQEKFFDVPPRARATQDYQLITVIPNLFDLDAFDHGDKIIIFGGTHGIAQRGIEPLLRSDELISQLREATRDHPYWQALFKVPLHDGQPHVPRFLGAYPIVPMRQGRALFELFTWWVMDHERALGIDSILSGNIVLEDVGVDHPR